MENWFVFKSYNRQHVFGWGTEEEAVKYESHLNEGPYYWAFYPVTDRQAEDLGLEGGDLGISLSIALQDIAEAS